MAAAEFSVDAEDWCFPVAGCVSYRGYFKQEKADSFARKLREKGFDTDVSPAIAYSTLGWFNDPLLDTMFAYDDEQLAGIVFHELAHQQLYVKNDTAFNEAYARFVEQAGVQRWLEHRQQTERWQVWLNARQASAEFNQLLASAREDLDQLYSSGQPPDELREQKRQRLDRLQADYHTLVEQSWEGQDYFAGWFRRELNNARLALMSAYEGGGCAFQQLFEDAGRAFEAFHRLAEQKSRLDAALRTQWLKQPCETIAPAGFL